MNNEMLQADLYGTYRTRTFSEIYPTVDLFLDDYLHIGIPPTFSSDETASTLYYLLMASKANSSIASSDENRFRLELFAIIFSKGPTWEKRLDVQKQLRTLSMDDLMYGAQAIYNTALNPANGDAYDTADKPKKLNQLNQQNVTHYKKSKLEAYTILWEALREDVTSHFLKAFDKLFNQFGPELPLTYVTEV